MTVTEEQLDEVYERRARIERAVRGVVSAELQGVDPTVADLVRLQLHEQFRFW